ncbi:cell division ATP-binding protein FtsE [uncultured Microscilla sp.]|uniref:cell division ATP-binding protein FtsE n=1 Tax=uncultured Microscilla sp. TaxID=432653 RepID=UPI0026021E0B|nr:ATP-binding cassette domain-containing protein [uncultured Microscilla sp.]
MSFLAPDNIIEVNNANIYQQASLVLSGLNFTIQKGEFVYIIGRTGTGKSSLLKTLYADLPLRKGQVHVAGFEVNQLLHREIPFLRRKLGIVFQDFQLLPDRNIADNLAFVMRATGWKNTQKIQQRTTELLQQVDLPGINKKFPHQLSGGEQQRVVIARALINEPMVLLADEPTGNLDPDMSEEILKLFQRINNSGTAILMATHDYEVLEKFPARVLKCANGVIEDLKVFP